MVRAFQKVHLFSTSEKYLRVARVRSWIGWIFSFCFGSILLGLPPLHHFILVLFAFSLATASIFILNQYFDRKDDQANTLKSGLPVASGKITPRKALIVSFMLIISCLMLVVFIDAGLALLFIVYLIFGAAYSAPPLRLKTVPIVDFIVSGVGAGFMPFMMGLELNGKLGSNILLILLGVVPLILIHCGGHIIQAVGDYEIDRKMRVYTFVVKYGKKKGVIVAGILFLLAGFLPLVYSVFALLPYMHLLIFFILFPLSMPIIKRYSAVLKKPSSQNVINMQKTATKYGVIGATVALCYMILFNIASV
ncbi:MAG: UbiA family prenyltransferase [Candidatus Bathyarchaeota archaeon]|nr:UbiA family prenyltransferase [Candidatus Bathyarchaeota archaeon]